MANSNIIIALDNMPLRKAFDIMEKTNKLVWGYKIRKLALEEGFKIIPKIKEFGNVMVDLKHYDIPTAIEENVECAVNYGADIVTILTSADFSPKNESLSQYIAGVSILTSTKLSSWKRSIVHYHDCKHMEHIANRCMELGYGYIVCPPTNVGHLKHLPIKKICPGIRPVWYKTKDDQNRATTPIEAVDAGADLLVIGRPLINSSDIVKAVEMVNK